MSKLTRSRRRKAEEDTDLDMVPIMNMFLVLIPFLLMSASFFHLKAINTSVPVLSAPATNDMSDEEKKTVPDIKLTVIVELKEKGIHLSVLSDAVDEGVLNSLSAEIPKKRGTAYPLDKLLISLENIKKQYPKSDTIIIIPQDTVVYDTIIQTMDIARYSNETPLFPKVVLSGKVG